MVASHTLARVKDGLLDVVDEQRAKQCCQEMESTRALGRAGNNSGDAELGAGLAVGLIKTTHAPSQIREHVARRSSKGTLSNINT